MTSTKSAQSSRSEINEINKTKSTTGDEGDQTQSDFQSEHQNQDNSKSNQFVHCELKRLKQAIIEQSKDIKHKERKDFHPYVFNSLHPYQSTKDVHKLINSPQDNQPIGHYNRYTAQNIVEPWIAHRMENNSGPIDLSLSSKLHNTSSNESSTIKFPKIDNRQPSKNQLTGSTLAPDFPKVDYKKSNKHADPLYYHDIKSIRNDIRNKLNNRNRIAEDRSRTINDYYRMNLDQTAEKTKMIEAYRAYLENTAGSKQALKELLSNSELLLWESNTKENRASKIGGEDENDATASTNNEA